ncbi:Fur family transcriptional regulator [Lentilactobacillus kosonis]|uniref:Peroxide stress regulator PerR, FUR family n=1 Tax=Lentilactobacillus kosonis TaxID=2810561 RepID=A0A401FMC1_9LACO|nr:Fur family transcriptional regulator [Lentilactobacillus kosonis]GAY73522.1 peroxide stress regulator PerR, FUR family [Lentilactobacillus kosonis]
MTSKTLGAALSSLKESGVRITPQREIILDYLIKVDTHPTVEMIHDGIDARLPNLSVATIYNTLKLLVDKGLVIELPNDDGGVRYDFFGTPHYHAICENCGKIVDIYSNQYAEIVRRIRAETADQTGYTVTGTQLEVTGLCPECQQKLQATSTNNH